MLSNGAAKATTVLVAIAFAAVALGVVYFVFLSGERRLEKLDVAGEQHVLQAYDRMIAAAEARNVDELFRHVLENDRGALILNGRLFLTSGAALQQTRENFRGLASVKYTVRERHVTLLSPTTALLVATGTSSFRTNDGREFALEFAHTVVFELQDGEWRVLHSHQSTPR